VIARKPVGFRDGNRDFANDAGEEQRAFHLGAGSRQLEGGSPQVPAFDGQWKTVGALCAPRPAPRATTVPSFRSTRAVDRASRLASAPYILLSPRAREAR